MKHLIINLSFLLVITSAGYAQNQVPDTHPEASISAFDYATGRETPRFSPEAILFKDALVDLVSNTTVFKIARIGFGRKSYVITQLDPNTSGNVYQLTLQRAALGQLSNVITFRYDVGQNTLSYYNIQAQNYIGVAVTGANLNNLNNCATYAAQFNVMPAGFAQPAQDASTAAGPDNDPPVTAAMAPPALQDDPQPECPTEGWLWQPGYYAYDVARGYYWTPGVWAAPTQVGFLWTPAYWGFENGVYLFHTGYWGATVGFYGGINYGAGYWGDGFVGGRWEGGHFMYNTAVLRVNVNIHNRYEDRSKVFVGVRNRAAFNGPKGVVKEPTPREREERMSNEKQVHAAHVAARQPVKGNRPPVKPAPKTGKEEKKKKNKLISYWTKQRLP